MSIIYVLCYLFSLLPLRLLYAVSDLCYIVIYYLIGYRKKVVRQNLTHAFANKTDQQCNAIEKKFYHHLCDLLLEHIKALTITPRFLLQHVTINDLAMIERYYKQGQSIILVSGHFGNWEWIAHALAWKTSYILTAGYQPLHHASTDQVVLHLRSRFERKAMPMAALFRHMATYKGPPQATTLLIDQAPFHKHNGHPMTFLTQPTTVSLTAAKLARKYNQPLFYIQIDQIKRGQYQAKPILLTAKPAQLPAQEIAERYTRRLEANILQNPALWLWSHRRWK
ncbi:MAG: lysophospholipid acyltransferase family protein [Candidatus Cardinium sp.]|nr:lysophospholipid acyltransferase family protein [Candidatus Cardinium sp.]